VRILANWVLALALASPLGAQEQQDQTPDPPNEEEEKDESAPRVRIYWDEGLHFVGLNRNFTTLVGGMVQNDTAFFSEQDSDEGELGRLENGLEWRRVRLYAEGVFARFFEYKFMYDFAANNPPRLKDAYLSYRLPFAPVRVQGGRFRTRLSLEGGTSAEDTTFLERGLLSAFVPVRNTGFLFYGDREDLESHLWWAVGLIQPENQFDVGATESFGVSGRFAYAWRDQESLDLLHLGVNLLSRPVDDAVRFLERPETHLAPEFVDTGDILASSTSNFFGEAALVRGAFSFQSEFGTALVNATDAANSRFFTMYAYASYFLTGENRRYLSSRASFGGIRPRRPFTDFKDSYGAVEIAFRYSHLDLDDQEINGGILNDFTAAVNWYPTNNARLMANLIRAQRSGRDGIWIFEIRLQWAY
jgi:phosphate-selective porin OprO/OprP